MAEQAASKVAVMVNVPPAMDERIVDWLLLRDVAVEFTSYVVYAHGTRHDHLSVAEQVSGRQRRLEFRVELAAEALDGFLADLAAAFRGADLHFAVSPMLRSGHLRE